MMIYSHWVSEAHRNRWKALRPEHYPQLLLPLLQIVSKICYRLVTAYVNLSHKREHSCKFYRGTCSSEELFKLESSKQSTMRPNISIYKVNMSPDKNIQEILQSSSI